MKQVTMIAYFTIVLLMLVGCNGNANGQSNDIFENNEIAENTSVSESEESSTDDKEAIHVDLDRTTSEKTDLNEVEREDNEVLSQYSNEQIEYARIWLKLGPNQELDEFYVQHIPAGDPLNPDDETSVNYPEDVIQLSGTRLVDGSVTYSGNGDGTINIYNVPLRWDGVYPAGEQFYQEIIDNTELVPVDTGDDQEIIALIKLLKH